MECKLQDVQLKAAITFSRSGGVAGLSEKITLEIGGSGITKNRVREIKFHLDPTAIREINSLLQDLDIEKLEPEYHSKEEVYDLIEYKLRIKDKQVRIAENAVPVQLKKLVAYLQNLMDQNQN